jgi:hypothetical protein
MEIECHPPVDKSFHVITLDDDIEVFDFINHRVGNRTMMKTVTVSIGFLSLTGWAN